MIEYDYELNVIYLIDGNLRIPLDPKDVLIPIRNPSDFGGYLTKGYVIERHGIQNLLKIYVVDFKKSYLIDINVLDVKKLEELERRAYTLTKSDCEMFINTIYNIWIKSKSFTFENIDFSEPPKLHDDKIQLILNAIYSDRSTWKLHECVKLLNNVLSEFGLTVYEDSPSPGLYVFYVIPKVIDYKLFMEAYLTYEANVREVSDLPTLLSVLHYAGASEVNILKKFEELASKIKKTFYEKYIIN